MGTKLYPPSSDSLYIYIFERHRSELATCLDGDGEVVRLEVVPEEGQSLDPVQEVTVLNKNNIFEQKSM